MLDALTQLEGIDFLYFPYNFIHARADYSLFLPRAIRAERRADRDEAARLGSIVQLDPRARPGAAPEFERLQLWQTRNRPILPAAVAELTKQSRPAARRDAVHGRDALCLLQPFVSAAITGMFDDSLLDNHKRLAALPRDQPGRARGT